MNQFLEAALRYTELSWAIFPCLPGQKVPATPHGVKDATTDGDQIREWWKQWPNANIAVACGEPSGVHVIDVDVTEAGDVNGWNSLVRLGQAGKVLPPTVKQGTPRGGAHFFFRTNNPPANKNSFLPGIDIRSTGYYVVIAPSIHPNGGQYKWAEGHSPWDRKPAEYPDFMRPEERPAPKQSAPPVPLSPLMVDSGITKRACAYLATCDPAVQGQGGHDKLLWAAVALVHGFLLPDGQAYDLLAHEYNPRCDPPWDLSERGDHKDFCRKITEARKLTPQHSPGWLLEDSEYFSAPSMFTSEDIRKLIEYEGAKRGGQACALTLIEVPALVRQERLLALTGDTASMEAELRFLTQPTGLLGDICSWINGCARKPQPWLTLGCALSFCGVLFGRKVEDEEGLRTNLYCMGIADSSAGKNHAPKKIRELCLEAGCVDLLGGDDFASDTAIESRLEKNPATLFLCDEIGHLFSAIKDGKNPYTAKIVSLLMKFYSSADSVYVGREYADVEKRRTIAQPNCCVYGYSSPERFFDALTPEELQDGWLSRCLLFYTKHDPRKRRGETVKKQSIPTELTQCVNDWFIRKLEREDMSVGNVVTPYSSGFQTRPPSPLVVPTSGEAEKIFVTFDDETIRFSVENPRLACLWKKGEENAKKIALIVAAGESFEDPVITPAIADYACRLVKRLLGDFSLRAPSITANKTEKDKHKLLTIIEKTGVQGCLKRYVTLRSQWLFDRERKAILADLEEAGEVVAERLLQTRRYWTADNYAIYRERQAQ